MYPLIISFMIFLLILTSNKINQTFIKADCINKKIHKKLHRKMNLTARYREGKFRLENCSERVHVALYLKGNVDNE